MANINLPKIGWQNGTLVSKAKVEIDGTIYEVEPEEYSGATPLSAENLIQMEENTEESINKVNEKTIGTVLYQSETGSKEDITLSESSANYDVIEIEYRYQGVYNTTKVFSPNGKVASLSIFSSITQYDAARAQYKTVEINGNSIINRQYGYITISESQTIGGSVHENNIYVTRVVGYNY